MIQSKEQNNMSKEEGTNATFNKFIIRGNVVRKNVSFGTLALKIKTAGVSNVFDYPWVVVYDEELSKAMDQDIIAGNRITVRGHIHTSKKHPDGVAVVTSYQKETALLDLSYSNSAAESFDDIQNLSCDMNCVTITGTLHKEPYSPNQTTLITVKSKGSNNSPAFVNMVCFGDFAKIAKQKKPGEEVRAVCYIKTTSTLQEKKNTHSYIVQALK